MIERHKHIMDIGFAGMAGLSLVTAVNVANLIAAILAGIASLMTIAWYALRFYENRKNKWKTEDTKQANG